MLGTFRHKGLEELFLTGSTRRIRADLVRKCIRLLQLLDAADAPDDMAVAGLHLYSLHGTPRRWSVRVTGNYRLTFGWDGKAATEVDFEDYH